MKCQNCNKEIKKEDKYCGNCGVKILKKKDDKYFQIIKENRLKIILCSILLVIVGLTYLVFNYISTASYKAMKYIKAVTNNKIEEIYNMLDLKETKLYNLKLLKQKAKQYENVSDTKITKEEENDKNALITFEYMSNEHSNIGLVSLTKENNKWTVNSGMVAKNVTFTLPKNATITLDNIDLSSYLSKEKSDELQDVYAIDYMVKGTYDILIKLEDGTEVKGEIEIEDDKNYHINNIDLKEEVNNQINATSLDLINNFYNGLMNDSENISDNEKINEYYKDINYDYKQGNFKLTKFEIKDLKQISVKDSNGYLKIKYQVEYDYIINYDGTDYSGTNRDTITLLYNYDYTLNSIKNIDLKFSIRK